MMKKILFLTVMVFMLGACTDSISDFNADTKRPEAVPSSALIANATVSLFDFMSSTNVNVNNFRLWAQQWSQTNYPDESNYQLVERNVNGRAWDRMYATVLRDLNEAKPLIDADQFLTAEEKTSQQAIIAIMETFVYSFLVDVFGDVPYTEAFTDKITPVYDNDADIYDAILANLNKALADLGATSGMGGTDLVYGGDTDSWKKFGNSLKLKLAIRLADSDDARAKTMAEAAVAAGVFTGGDDFKLGYEGSTPNTNPLWESLVESGRFDFIASNTMADFLNPLNDPRRAAFYKNLDVDGNVTGGTYGDANSYAANSQPGTILEDPTTAGVIMSYTEVEFLLADAVERGYNVGGTAAEHYDAGVTNSIMEWGGSANDATTYLAQANVAYATAPGTWKEKVAMQKWIALYNMGFEAWTTYRIYDAPAMNIAVGAGTLPPLRYTYPVTEFSLNGENREAAAAAMGGDDLMTPVFWDVN